jgi:hypothetical protein
MADIDIFNGDADGVCALTQLRNAEPRESTLITGVKRDIALVAKAEVSDGDRITALDISFDKNREGVLAALEAGAEIFYVDHHFAGEIPDDDRLTTIIDTDANVCTSLLVNGYLEGAYVEWAVTGAFGDNLHDTARRLAAGLDIAADDLASLEELGTCINYNGYGPAIEDLHFDPEDLYRRLFAAGSPLAFVRDSADFRKLSEGYREDMGLAAALEPMHATGDVAVFILPDQSWARRVSGVYSNDLATGNPDRAHAVLTEKANGNYLVSVRAPLSNKQGAAELCMQFPTGGGRAAAAGINDLPADSLDAFIAAFGKAYAG